jgi:hypothetical protein
MALINLKCGNNLFQANIDQLVIAGWTGRNREAVEHHINELEKLVWLDLKQFLAFIVQQNIYYQLNQHFNFVAQIQAVKLNM